jgi:hypothetical protein
MPEAAWPHRWHNVDVTVVDSLIYPPILAPSLSKGS